MNKFIAFNKLILLGFWLAFIVNVFLPFAGAVGQWIMWIGLVILGVHLLELAVVYKRLQVAGHLTAHNVMWILVAGILHWRPLLRD